MAGIHSNIVSTALFGEQQHCARSDHELMLARVALLVKKIALVGKEGVKCVRIAIEAVMCTTGESGHQIFTAIVDLKFF